MPNHNDLKNAYEELKGACSHSWIEKTTGDAILNLAILSLKFLESESEYIDLVSRVPGKQYSTFRKNNVVARPANKKYFVMDLAKINDFWNTWESSLTIKEDLKQILYTIALAPCLAMELFDRQNKKGPATYFECLIGHIFAKTFNKEPKKSMSFEILQKPEIKSVRMTMDFLFALGEGKPNIHLPVKMSTRERVVQAWAHQRILNSAYGEETYKGIMVLFSETKMNSRSLEVVEICVPDQWLTYQILLAKLNKIYYFDVPDRYQSLTNEFKDIIEIKQFGEFFNQIELIVN